jgi:polar amino acid transport system permease protein
MKLDIITSSVPFLLEGAAVTLKMSLGSLFLGILLGTLVVTIRLYGSRFLVWLSIGYIELIRGTPMLVQIFIIFFGLPQILPIEINETTAGILAMSINSGAYVAEILRSGIQAIPKGHTEAGLSLGLSRLLILRRIIFPQAFVRVIPPLVNEAIALLKNSSLLSAIAVIELTRAGQLVASRTFRPFEMYLAVSLVYLVMTMSLSLCGRWFERRFQVRH